MGDQRGPTREIASDSGNRLEGTVLLSLTLLYRCSLSAGDSRNREITGVDRLHYDSPVFYLVLGIVRALDYKGQFNYELVD